MVSTLKLWCGCTASVVRDPLTGLTVSRIVSRKSPDCDDTAHHTGARAWLIDQLPNRVWRCGGPSDDESCFVSEDVLEPVGCGTENASGVVQGGALYSDNSVRS